MNVRTGRRLGPANLNGGGAGTLPMAQTTLRFIFISEAAKPTVSVTVPGEMLFQEAFVLASKKLAKDAGVLSATYPGGAPITGGTVKDVAEKSSNIHVIDPSLVGRGGEV
jgi:hypothetical protein